MIVDHLRQRLKAARSENRLDRVRVLRVGLLACASRGTLLAHNRPGDHDGGGADTVVSGKTVREWRESRELPDGWFTHGRRGRQDLGTENVIQLTTSWDIAEQYAGRNGSEWMIAPSSDASIGDLTLSANREPIIDKFLSDHEEGKLSPALDEIAANSSRDELDDLLNPNDIVNSAGLWDEREFATWAYDRTSHDVIKTNNGAVVLNKDKIQAIKSAGSKQAGEKQET